MQKIINLSKFVSLLIFTSILLLVWMSNVMEVKVPLASVYSDLQEVEYQAVPQLQPPSLQVDPAAQVVAPSNNSIWHQMRSQFYLDTRAQSPQVQAEIHKLLAEPKKFVSIMKAAIPYIYYINQQTELHGLPAEIALIPVIESEYNPHDKSNKGAAGLWQLMRQTAHELGIKIHAGYDGRVNVVASTKAALAYFKDLGNMFNGNWYLAIAAYNCGQGRVLSAIHKTGSHSFWNLPLPKETKYYVPRLLAVAEIIKHPEKYGVTLPQAQAKPYFKTVSTTKPVNLNQVAKTSGISIQTLTQLNPDFGKNAKITATFGGQTLLVPADKAAAVKAQLG